MGWLFLNQWFGLHFRWSLLNVSLIQDHCLWILQFSEMWSSVCGSSLHQHLHCWLWLRKNLLILVFCSGCHNMHCSHNSSKWIRWLYVVFEILNIYLIRYENVLILSFAIKYYFSPSYSIVQSMSCQILTFFCWLIELVLVTHPQKYSSNSIIAKLYNLHLFY